MCTHATVRRTQLSHYSVEDQQQFATAAAEWRHRGDVDDKSHCSSLVRDTAAHGRLSLTASVTIDIVHNITRVQCSSLAVVK